MNGRDSSLKMIDAGIPVSANTPSTPSPGVTMVALIGSSMLKLASRFPKPCNDAILSLEDLVIVDGKDELGVLLYGHAKNAYWFGSQLTIEETRELAPYQNATGLQVTSAVVAGIAWTLENPNAGIVEADEMDFKRCLDFQLPYLGTVRGYYTDWNPLAARQELFKEDVDKSDPWQFKNILV